MTCPEPISHSSKRRGQTCGRPIRGFVAPGHGRCAFHLTAKIRARVLATVRAERELRELRDAEPFDVDGFVELDEL